MRRDKQTGQYYSSYMEWLQDGRIVWVITLFWGYAYYLMTTERA